MLGTDSTFVIEVKIPGYSTRPPPRELILRLLEERPQPRDKRVRVIRKDEEMNETISEACSYFEERIKELEEDKKIEEQLKNFIKDVNDYLREKKAEVKYLALYEEEATLLETGEVVPLIFSDTSRRGMRVTQLKKVETKENLDELLRKVFDSDESQLELEYTNGYEGKLIIRKTYDKPLPMRLYEIKISYRGEYPKDILENLNKLINF